MPVRVEEYQGGRAALRPLFELAEDSRAQLDSYLGSGRVLAARCGEQVIGHLQLTDTEAPETIELKNMAVLASHRGQGVGQALLTAAVERARREGRTTLLVATAAADIDNLRFYQRAGFRMRSIERDAFTEATGYAPQPPVGGIELRDRVWLDLRI